MESNELTMIRAMLFQMKQANSAPKTIEQIRQANVAAMARLNVLAQGTVVEKTTVAGLPAEWITAPGASKATGVILYLHGGGFYSGSCETHRGIAFALSQASGLASLLPEYRLAPEHPYPAANDDCIAVYRQLLADGIRPERIALCGDSAGGSLVLMTLLRLRDAGEPLPRAAVLLSPWADLVHFDGESYVRCAALDPVGGDDFAAETQRYIPAEMVKTSEMSPLRCDLSGLPPMLIQVGSHERLLDDAVRLAERAKAAGVDAELQVYDGLFHIFQTFYAVIPEAREAVAAVGNFLKNN